MPPAPSPEDGRKRFVSEHIQPDGGPVDVEAMARGEPGLPRAFVWRDRRYAIANVISRWRTLGEDRGDNYIRRHWYEVDTECGRRMHIYFDRNPGRSGCKRGRWWLYAVVEPPNGRTTPS
jgi:hypothetical protein